MIGRSSRVTRLARRAGGVVVTSTLAVVALGLGVVAISGVFGHRTLVVRSGSMRPTAPVGSLVVTRSISASAVKVGTIVVVQPERAKRDVLPTLHRVVRVDRTPDGVVVRTKGDANDAVDPDPHTLRPTVLTPMFIVPRIGLVIGATHTWAGWLLLIVMPGALLLCAGLRAIWTDRDGEPSAVVAPGNADAPGRRGPARTTVSASTVAESSWPYVWSSSDTEAAAPVPAHRMRADDAARAAIDASVRSADVLAHNARQAVAEILASARLESERMITDARAESERLVREAAALHADTAAMARALRADVTVGAADTTDSRGISVAPARALSATINRF